VTRWLRESSSYSPPDSLHPVSNQRLLPFARPSASSISTTSHIATFVVCNWPLLDWNSRSRLASEQVFQPARLRRNCGPQSNVSGIHLLSKISALKLRLERFRTSHARVKVNLLLWQIAAREIKCNFVSFLFKRGPSCGVAWEIGCKYPICTLSSAKLRPKKKLYFREARRSNTFLFGFRHKTKLHAPNSTRGVILLSCSKNAFCIRRTPGKT
jgi:hypothetical protein